VEILVHVLLFALWAFILVKSSEYFLESAEKIGLWLGFSPILIGILLLGFGTSLPELVTSTLAVIKGSGEAVLGNVIGSNITNILLVLGISALLARNYTVPYDVVKKDIGFLFAASMLLYFVAQDGSITLREALFLLLSFVFFVDLRRRVLSSEKKKEVSPKTFGIFVLSLLALYISADNVVNELIVISSLLSLPVFVTSSILLALSTSLPELVVSATSALRGKSALSIGNIIGSNIFNSLVVLSIPSFFGEIKVSDVLFPLSFMFFSIFLLYLVSIDRKISKQEAIILLVLYLFYVGKSAGII